MSHQNSELVPQNPFLDPQENSCALSINDSDSNHTSPLINIPSSNVLRSLSAYSPSKTSMYLDSTFNPNISTFSPARHSIDTPMAADIVGSPIFTSAPITPTQEVSMKGRVRVHSRESGVLPSEALEMNTPDNISFVFQREQRLSSSGDFSTDPHLNVLDHTPFTSSSSHLTPKRHPDQADDPLFEDGSQWTDFSGVSDRNSSIDHDRLSRMSGAGTSRSLQSDLPLLMTPFSNVFDATPISFDGPIFHRHSTERVHRSHLHIDSSPTQKMNLTAITTSHRGEYSTSASYASGYSSLSEISIEIESMNTHSSFPNINDHSASESETSISFETSHSLHGIPETSAPNSIATPIPKRSGSVRLPPEPSQRGVGTDSLHSDFSSSTSHPSTTESSGRRTANYVSSPKEGPTTANNHFSPTAIPPSVQSPTFLPTPPPPRSPHPSTILNGTVQLSVTFDKTAASSIPAAPVPPPVNHPIALPYTDTTPFTVEPYKKSEPLFTAPPPKCIRTPSTVSIITPPQKPSVQFDWNKGEGQGEGKLGDKVEEVVSTVKGHDGKTFKLVQSFNDEGIISIQFSSLDRQPPPLRPTTHKPEPPEPTVDPPPPVPPILSSFQDGSEIPRVINYLPSSHPNTYFQGACYLEEATLGNQAFSAYEISFSFYSFYREQR
ncbi:hypothetical protein BLNAU_17397 [Blattamonas nauphoetae]|uniref:Uncharacterized protein n=1 Tax=Blattamonas nauphoetae TaxID=2049346 RepID=A0ABQ9X8J4_9EUKA|nr:hypothetical protein BLNAU_17397 [Blattamonas nauphoetae]